MSRCADDVLTVTAQLDQMVALLQLELSSENNNAETRILDTILSGDDDDDNDDDNDTWTPSSQTATTSSLSWWAGPSVCPRAAPRR